MNQVEVTHGRVWQGMLAALLLALVLFSEAIIGAEPERPAALTAVEPLEHLETHAQSVYR